jgi:hypothetical protein
MEKGVIPLVRGGIGNQMFIMAAAYSVHKTKGIPLYILKAPPNKHNTKNHDYNIKVFKYFGIHIEEPKECFNYNNVSPGGFSAWSPENIESGSFMDDYFQYYPAIKPFEVNLRELLLKALPVPLKEYSDYAFLHIRRGDYLDISHIHYIQPLEYYRKASENFNKILVVSDDMAWVKQQELFKNTKYELFESDDEIETLSVMSRCTAGAICANSTFSWWGAFLGAYEKRKEVYVPKDWISLEIVSLFPEEWIII